jgi:small-conductance mechanosensitive channel
MGTALLAVLAAPALSAQSTSPAPGAATPTGTNFVLGQWPNPLPPPLDGHFGTFLLDVLAWLAIAAVARLLVGPVLKAVARRTKTTLDDKAIDILGTPLFVILFLVGVRSSLRAFALPVALAHALDVVASLVGITAVGYVLFRAWNEVALVYARRLAERTSSTVDNRVLPVFEKLGGVLIILLAAVYFLQALGVGFSWLLAGGAFASLVVGLAAQDTLSNFFSGLHLLLDQPFLEGDEIQLESGEVCVVRRIGLRSSHLYHARQHEMIIVPNNLLATKAVTNLMRPDRRHRQAIAVGVAYRSDPDKVKRVLTEAALAHPQVVREPGREPVVRLVDFGDSALQFELVLFIQDQSQRANVASDLRIAIVRRFAEAGIDIPFPHRVMVAPDTGRRPEKPLE